RNLTGMVSVLPDDPSRRQSDAAKHGRPTSRVSDLTDATPSDPIEHVIVLMLENRSFDHILGGTAKMRAVVAPDGTNKYAGKTYRQQPGAARTVANDPVHETPDVLVQMGSAGAAPQSGFVLD